MTTQHPVTPFQPRQLSRRAFLRATGASAGALLLGACSEQSGSADAEATDPEPTTSVAAATDQTASDTSAPTEETATAPDDQFDLLSTLRGGGLVIYFRHGATTWSGVDDISWPREQQRLLSDLGIAQSEEIGQAFDLAEIPVGEVLASPFARCRDMAEIAFGRVDVRDELLGLLSDEVGLDARVEFLTTMLTSPPAPGENRVIVAHRSNIQTVAGVSLAEGEGVVVRPTNDGFEALVQLMPEDWPTGR